MRLFFARFFSVFPFTILVVFCLFSSDVFAQGSSEYAGGYKIKFNEDGSKYFRVISWGQLWATFQDKDGPEKDFGFSVRRARVLSFMQLNKRFLLLTHFGVNSVNGDNLSPTGKGADVQLFFHDFWGEFRIYKNHHVGAGLHYWNGISRLNSQSTLNMLTLDNNRQSWATIGLSDQFARHLGLYFKGKFGKLQYRLSINEALKNNLNASTNLVAGGPAVYAGRRLLGSEKAGILYAGYLDYNILDQESNLLPFKVGSYLGSKRVLNVGAGFFYHPYGAAVVQENDTTGQDVLIFAVDAFYDAPLGANNGAITAYLSYQNSDYGRNYELGSTYSTGGMVYTHVGYLLPGQKDKVRVQPYASLNWRAISAGDKTALGFGVGTNILLTGHHSKISLEYNNSKYGEADAVGRVIVQAMIYL